MSSSLSGNGLKACKSFASTAMICSKVPGRPDAPAPNCSSVLSLSVVVDVTEFSHTVLGKAQRAHALRDGQVEFHEAVSE
jgi:hypothetical protein